MYIHPEISSLEHILGCGAVIGVFISVMESKHGSESNKHPSKDDDNYINEDDALSPLISIRGSDRDSESEADIDINIDEKTPDSGKKSRSSHPASASSFSSESSSDFFHIDAKMLNKSSTFHAGSPKDKEDSQSPKEKEKNDKPGESYKSKDCDKTSLTDATSQVSHAISNPTSQTMSPAELPPKQVMERSGDYDPNRIPASVFEDRPSSSMDWSAASNDSLFSLNIGNNSFSREQFLMSGDMFGEDVNRSDELYDSGEWNKSGELNKPGEANKSELPPLSPIGKLHKIKTMDADKKTINVDKNPKQTKATDEDVSDQLEKVKCELDGKGNSSMINRLSDESASSSQSFAFPILVDTTKYTSVKGPFTRKQDPKLDVYAETGSAFRSGVAASAVVIIVPRLTAHVPHLAIVGAGSGVRSGVAAVTVAYKNTSASHHLF
ncbi:hypothetical protein POM88_027842 [Heracleum sosnowskyi]|uniref:Uncharacterized protein n=1 Tax=Heracleum sosnowskyi TaxID=360622 RepID=A0AAD8I9A9_9APIA|nr:hypothetical protein POM88_027842 [Heracleum sosnowskyi]